MLDTPVILVMFRRPELTERVLQAVRAVKPRRLLVVADGPRHGRPGDREAVDATRAVIDRIDWSCDVTRHYADENLGCRRRLSTGLSWAFSQVEEAIVLEDDCVPHVSFFHFCREMLERYRHDERVMHVAGSILRARPIATDYSYVFSRFNPAWGWASWRRAWQRFDVDVRNWPRLRPTSWLADLVRHPRAVEYWRAEFDRAHAGTNSTWDHQWTFACWRHRGLSIVPAVNLVSNAGCGTDATHTLADDPCANLPACEMQFPLVHPPAVAYADDWDEEFLRGVVLPRLGPPPPSRLRRTVSRVLPEWMKQGYRQWRGALAWPSR